MWPAHILTLVRLPLALAIAFAYGRPALVVALIVAAAASDAADGHVARWLKRRGKSTPDIGGWLDPLIDKIFVVIVLAAIVVHTRDVVVVALIGARELLLVPLLAVYVAVRRDHPRLQADPIGKVATIAQFLALAIAVAQPAWALWPALVAAGCGLAAVVHYIVMRIDRP
jgi:phosphatidylglycerophosphate synthase